jgi:protein gp37
LTFAERFRGVPGHPYEQGFDLRLWPNRLEYPVQWKQPRMIFVNSMSDLMHKDIPDAFILSVFDTMIVKAPQHIYQVLTKRPSRLVNTTLLSQVTDRFGAWPPHIWLGVSVETMAYAWRVEQLRRVPAPIKCISAEPLLAFFYKQNASKGHKIPLPALDGKQWNEFPVCIREKGTLR